MVTLMPAGSGPEPHRHRHIAESFGTDPRQYDRARPAYPEAMIKRIVAASPGGDFLDVGCGTGIEGRQFRAVGATVLGVEPDPRMADHARGTGLPVEVATFETWEPAGRTFDAVVCGTAWHWIDPVAGAAKAARVLRPGGVLAPFGSIYQLPPAAARALAAAGRRVAPDSPLTPGDRSGGSMLEAYRALYDKAADGIRAAGGFGAAEVWRYDWTRVCTHDELLQIMATSGGLTALPDGQAQQVLTEVGAALGDPQGTLTLPYVTWGLTALKRDGHPAR
ncbi:class I SAM-dependent methyltransferase [Mangrovihabitans endophyticus]|uniref:Methyltransferase type 11 n=1 Tax=Mangrovihabitans endophyticus TaxID=1751298 RepID=A0A8J3C2T3_9ACTN|nr:class I SAM-dependent methyltransferase [Mangrovihabitans endophyticus]GGL00925.1 methyltransferase type 11 [Mangrovihabitans endophyticus]